MNQSDFRRQLQALYRRVERLQQRDTASTALESHVAVETLETLQFSLEELRVAEEEMRQQYEELAATRHAVEAERCRYQELFDFAPHAYLVTDAAGTIREANRVAATLLGVSKTRLVGKPLAVFVDAAERPAFRRRLLKLAQVSRLDDWEIRLRPRRGAPFAAALTVASMRNPEDTLVGLRWLLRDITARKQAKEALQQSEARYRALIEGAMQGMLIIEDALIRFANPAGARIFGYASPDDLIGQKLDLLITPRDQERIREAVAAYSQTAPVLWNCEFQGLRRDGRPLWIECQMSRIVWEGTTVYLGTFLDVTERQQAEQALRDSEARSLAILESAVEGIITIDAQGRIESFNPAAQCMFGYGPEEVVGQNIAMLMPAPYREEHAGYLTQYLCTGERKIIGIGREVVGQRKDGTLFPMSLAVSEVCLGNQRLFTGFVRDLTRRKQAEQEMQRADRLSLVGQLASGSAHEIGTPLNVIAGNAELLRMQYKELEMPTTGLETIIAQSERITRLIEQLLTFARPQSLPMSPIALRDPLAQALQLLQTRLTRQAITVSVSVPSDLPLILGVSDQLEQVFLNVLVNAWHAMPNGGMLTIQARPTTDHYVRIIFQDTGHGIPAQDLTRVFEPFYTTKGDKGSGLGLAVCQQIIHGHGGTISLHSTPGEGTTVTIGLAQADTVSGQ